MIIAGLLVFGACGAALRFVIDHLIQRHFGSEFPLGTLVINVSGSLALGVLTGSAMHHGVSAAWLTVAGTGLIGAYTTFSTFTFDTVRLAEGDRWGLSLINLAASLGAGLAAAAAGLALGTLT